jgi:hypothetical protein
MSKESISSRVYIRKFYVCTQSFTGKNIFWVASCLFCTSHKKYRFFVKLCEQIYLFEFKSVYILLDYPKTYRYMFLGNGCIYVYETKCISVELYQNLFLRLRQKTEKWEDASLIGWAVAFLFVNNLPNVHTMLQKLCGWVSVWIIATSRILHFANFLK